MARRRGRLTLLAAALLVAGAAVAAVGWADDDHLRAKKAYDAGRIVSLQAILERVQAEFLGSPVAIELEEEDDRWIYTVKLLTRAGAIVRLEYDARDAKLLRVKGRGAERVRR